MAKLLTMPVSESLPNSKALNINELIELTIDTSRGTAYCRSRVEDILEDHLVVALPTETPELVAAKAGLPVGVIKKSEDGLFLINVKVVGKVLSPVPLLTLRTEGDWTRIQRRRDVRLPVTFGPLSATVIGEESERTLDITVINISAGGLLFRAKERVGVSTTLAVKLELPGFPPAIEAVFEVVRVDDSEVGQWKRFNMGARFVGLNQKARDRIVKFIFREQVRRGR